MRKEDPHQRTCLTMVSYFLTRQDSDVVHGSVQDIDVPFGLGTLSLVESSNAGEDKSDHVPVAVDVDHSTKAE
jgi:hypothetical protein